MTVANDGPGITSAAQSGNVSEGDGLPAAAKPETGHVTLRYLDSRRVLFRTVSAAAAHGTASVDAVGNWTYTVSDSGAVDALAVGEHLADSFTVQVDDHHGGLDRKSVV